MRFSQNLSLVCNNIHLKLIWKIQTFVLLLPYLASTKCETPIETQVLTQAVMESVLPGIEDMRVYLDDVGTFLGLKTPYRTVHHISMQAAKMALPLSH